MQCASHVPSIAIVGGGFSGTLLALHLLRTAPRGTLVRLIERRGPIGVGLAYATGNPSHLLNVRAGNMSAFSDSPDHFVDWLNATPSRWGEPRSGRASFVPRRDYGAYLRFLFETELARENFRGTTLDPVIAEVEDVGVQDQRARLSLRHGRTILADFVILATGGLPALPPRVSDPAIYATHFYQPDPWAPQVFAGLDRDQPVLLIGTGLTAVDLVMSLLDAGHRGPIHLLSRRGLLPQPHVETALPPFDAGAYPPNARVLLRQMRRDARDLEAVGQDWRSVIDAIRPFTACVWQSMAEAEQARFLRHARPYWEVHRHRMAPATFERLAAGRRTGQVRVHSGRIARYEQDGETVSVVYRPRGASGGEGALRAARIVNCTGQTADYARIGDPAVRALLGRGLARPDPLRLGLDVTQSGALRAADGAVSRRLFALGALTRGMAFETIAVPDIRLQCERLAGHLVRLLPAAAPHAVVAAGH